MNIPKKSSSDSSSNGPIHARFPRWRRVPEKSTGGCFWRREWGQRGAAETATLVTFAMRRLCAHAESGCVVKIILTFFFFFSVWIPRHVFAILGARIRAIWGSKYRGTYVIFVSCFHPGHNIQ